MYFFQLLELFKPWRDESDLCTEGKTSYETLVEKQLNYPVMKEYHEQQVHTTSQDEEIDTAV